VKKRLDQYGKDLMREREAHEKGNDQRCKAPEKAPPQLDKMLE